MSALRMIALAGAALLAAPAHAATLPAEPLPDLLAAAKAICFDHVGDPAGQTATARAKPFEAERVRTNPDGSVIWNTARYSIAILDEPGKKFCMVTAVIDPRTKAGDGIKLARPLLGEPESADEEFVMWYGKTAAGKPAMYGFMIKPEGDNILGSYASGTE